MQNNKAKLLTLHQGRRLPDSWIQRIFSVLQAHYGIRWLNMWKINQSLPDGQDAGLVNAMNVWAEKLAGFEDSPETFKKVFEVLPHDPPTLPQFLDLCRHAYVAPKHPQLEHKMTEEEYAKGRKHISEIVENLRRKMSMTNKTEIGADNGH